MNTLELSAKVLANQLTAGVDAPETVIQEGLRSFAVDALNYYQSLRNKDFTEEMIKEFVEVLGLTLNLKTKKFQ